MARTDPALQGEQAPEAAPAPSKRRTYVSQADIPSCTLDEALRIPFALSEEYGKRPATPLDVAAALDLLPKTGHSVRLRAPLSPTA